MSEFKLKQKTLFNNDQTRFDDQGNQMQGLVLAVNEDHIVMDFNHPLAGKDLHFQGSVNHVRDASAEEMAHGHVHGEGGHHH